LLSVHGLCSLDNSEEVEVACIQRARRSRLRAFYIAPYTYIIPTYDGVIIFFIRRFMAFGPKSPCGDISLPPSLPPSRHHGRRLPAHSLSPGQTFLIASSNETYVYAYKEMRGEKNKGKRRREEEVSS
jgi:hypothetical protein